MFSGFPDVDRFLDVHVLYFALCGEKMIWKLLVAQTRPLPCNGKEQSSFGSPRSRVATNARVRKQDEERPQDGRRRCKGGANKGGRYSVDHGEKVVKGNQQLMLRVGKTLGAFRIRIPGSVQIEIDQTGSFLLLHV